MTTLTAVRSRTMPRVNLLPPEIGQRAAFRRVQVGLGAGVVAVCGVVAGLYVLGAHAKDDAQHQLTASQSLGTSLTAEQANYADVRPVYNAAAATKTQMVTAMGGEVRTSFILNDLALLIPKNVWLTGMQITVAPPAGAAAPATAGSAATAVPIGTVTFSGNGLVENDVAAWLDALATENGVASPYFSNSTTTTGAGKAGGSVTFASTATLTSAALSQRYTAKAAN